MLDVMDGEVGGLPDDLLAVCEGLALKALEKVGKLVVKTNRSRSDVARNSPWHLAHVALVVSPRDLDKGLWGAWDVAPFCVNHYARAPLTVPRIVHLMDQYVRGLVVAQRPHTRESLRRVLEEGLVGRG